MAFIKLPEHTAEWHAHRLKYIGGSEVAALFGEEEQPDQRGDDVTANWSESMFSLHYIKSGAVPARVIVGVDRVDAGTFMEPSIAAFAASRRDWLIAKGDYAIDDTTPGMGASLDYVITDAGPDADGVEAGGVVMRGLRGPLVGPGVLQIKNVDGLVFREKWGAEPPVYVLLQLQHEIACAGYRWGVLAALVAGNRLCLYFYEAHHEIIAEIRKKITEHWQRVRDGRPPNADGSDATSYVLRQLYPVTVDNETAPLDLTGNNRVPELCAALAEVAPNRLSLQKQEADLKGELESILGQCRYAVCGPWRIKCSVVKANPGRLPRPDELIGVRQEGRRFSVKLMES